MLIIFFGVKLVLNYYQNLATKDIYKYFFHINYNQFNIPKQLQHIIIIVTIIAVPMGHMDVNYTYSLSMQLYIEVLVQQIINFITCNCFSTIIVNTNLYQYKILLNLYSES